MGQIRCQVKLRTLANRVCDFNKMVLQVRICSKGSFMSRKGPKVGQGMLDFIEDCCIGVKLH